MAMSVLTCSLTCYLTCFFFQFFLLLLFVNLAFDSTESFSYDSALMVKFLEASSARLNKGCTIRKKPDFFFQKQAEEIMD
jgi:hypothetical protein